MTSAAPNGTSTTRAPAARNSATEVMWVWLPTPELPTVMPSGRALPSAMSSPSVFHLASPRTATTGNSTSTCATGAKAW